MIPGFHRLSLATRLMAGMALFIIISSVVLAYYIINVERESYIAARGAITANRLERSLSRLELTITDLRRDALLLAQVPPVQGILRAMRNQGIDPMEGLPADAWNMRLQEIFSVLIQTNQPYIQASYISLAGNGRELVRVDYKDGRVMVVPPAGLQAQGDSDYFQATLKLGEGEVYLSGINLHREQGSVQLPHKRIIRAATPVFAPDGDLFGMVVLILDLAPVINLITTNLQPGLQAYLMNDAGDYLAHPDPAHAFGFDPGRRYTWQEDMPDLQIPTSPDTNLENLPFQTIASTRGHLHIVVGRFQFDPGAPQRFLLLAYAIPDEFINAYLMGMRNKVMSGTLIMMLCIGAVVFLILRRTFAPLKQLTLVAHSIGAGNYDIPLPREGIAEMGVFANAFARMQEDIRTREQEQMRLYNALEASLNEIYMFDFETLRFTYVNRGARENLGYSLETLQKMTPIDIQPEFTEATFRALIASLLRHEQPHLVFQTTHKRVNGTLYPIEVRLQLVETGERHQFLAIIYDITARKQAEQEIQLQMKHTEALLEAVPDPIVITDNNGMIVRINQQAEKVFGYTRTEMVGQPVEILMPERFKEGHARSRQAYSEAPTTRPMGRGRELYALRKDGSEFPVDISLSPLETTEGTLIISNVHDITERKQAEQKIREQLERMKLLDQITRSIGERQDLKSIFQVVLRSIEDKLPADFNCICLYNQADQNLRVENVGLKGEAVGRELALTEKAVINVNSNGLSRCMRGELIYEPDIGQSAYPFPQLLARGGQRSLVLAPLRSESQVFGVLITTRIQAHAFSSTECEFLRQLCEHVALAVGQARLYDALQVAYDDLRQSQKVIMQQERLHALGQMASGIAHDINNAISPVALYSELLLETEPDLSQRARGYLETIQRAVEDVAYTISSMREFYRQRDPHQIMFAPLDVNRIVQQTIDLTRAYWEDTPQKRGIVVRLLTELAPDLPKIMAAESEIREALTNLIFNAVDAIPQGGELALRTVLIDQGEGRSSIAIEVTDSGAGMDEKTRRHCLEPFFTTKGERGTGLGLAMVYGVVQRHSAEIEIESSPGAGTTVRLIFAVAQNVQGDSDQPRKVQKVPARLHLLLIDDDPLLLRSMTDTLEADGHIIVTANGGPEGIEVFRASLGDDAEPFAAVITDLGMPYVDGRKVAAAVKESSPATPVILLTGWGQRMAEENDIPPHVDRVLAKPPKLGELREVLTAYCCRSEPGGTDS